MNQEEQFYVSRQNRGDNHHEDVMVKLETVVGLLRVTIPRHRQRVKALWHTYLSVIGGIEIIRIRNRYPTLTQEMITPEKVQEMCQLRNAFIECYAYAFIDEKDREGFMCNACQVSDVVYRDALHDSLRRKTFSARLLFQRFNVQSELTTREQREVEFSLNIIEAHLP